MPSESKRQKAQQARLAPSLETHGLAISLVTLAPPQSGDSF